MKNVIANCNVPWVPTVGMRDTDEYLYAGRRSRKSMKGQAEE